MARLRMLRDDEELIPLFIVNCQHSAVPLAVDDASVPLPDENPEYASSSHRCRLQHSRRLFIEVVVCLPVSLDRQRRTDALILSSSQGSFEICACRRFDGSVGHSLVQ